MYRFRNHNFFAQRVSALALLALCCAASGWTAEAFRDPTRPPQLAVTQKVVKGSWKLTSILVSPGRRVAMINGRAVLEGALIDGARLVAIKAGSVRLRQNRQEFTLSLQEKHIKEPAADAVERTWEQ